VNNEEVEREIQKKGLNAPRVTSNDIQGLIEAEDYHVFEGTAVTVCCLTLRNKFKIIGYSAAVSLENFDAEIGRSIARRNAASKVWELEGYLLRQRIFDGEAEATGDLVLDSNLGSLKEEA